ncbi:MAG: Holliday junction resolvase RuvX [Oscillospiraceae bacterium]|jgi:putative Holliday junction resolvase|nr:Holliday junction resolvase RuvX [Oscillospiraceae bacterium]
MIHLGIDYGDVRTGVAVSDTMGVLASPVQVIQSDSRKKLLTALCAIAKERGAGAIVLGLPLNMDGSRGERAIGCEALAKQLEARTGLPVVLWDERLSTVAAHRALSVVNVRGQKRKRVVDAVAAVMILQGYLDSR